MARTFQLSVVAPDRSVIEEPVQSVIAPGVEGYFGMLAGHVPLVAALRPGLVEYISAENQRHYIVVGGGFAEMTGERMTVLADSAERASEVDVAAAQALLDEARRALRGEASTLTAEQATLEMERALTRIRAAKRN